MAKETIEKGQESCMLVVYTCVLYDCATAAVFVLSFVTHYVMLCDMCDAV